MILTNVRLVLEDEVVPGTIEFDETGIVSIDSGRSTLPMAVDGEGDLLAPGLVEMHTDNLEKHFVPRPQVFWPNGVAAAIAHDAQMAAAGVTTVFDAVCAGTNSGSHGLPPPHLRPHDRRHRGGRRAGRVPHRPPHATSAAN